METTVELTRFKMAPEQVSAMLTARPAMVADFESDRGGFLGARLIRLPNDEWLDVVERRSAEDFAASHAKGASLPGIAAFFATLGGLVSDETGTLAQVRGAAR
ncbi:hypothetical protein ACIHDR_08250 [Nocardia sp. NPDC052278]|uniref:hypothetical protein n=1 Tax=unclassified Nocardia TaxID=2637762 RepID=UPI00367D93D7